MGIFSKKKPLHLATIADIEAADKDCHSFKRGLLKFNKNLTAFEKASDKLILSSQDLLAGTGQGTTERKMQNVRGTVKTGMDKGVHDPIATWVRDHEMATKVYKALLKQAAEFEKTNKSMTKAADKQAKATRDGANPEAMQKISTAVMGSARLHDAAKTALAASAPKVLAQYQGLLARKAGLREAAFSAFTVSGDAMKGLAALAPKSPDTSPARKVAGGSELAVAL